MKKRLIFAILSAALLMTAFASAEIFIGPVNPTYNYGDELNLQVNLIPNTASASHLIGDITCGSVSSNIFNNYYNLAAGQEQQVNVGTLLVDLSLTEIIADCYVVMTYGLESESSDSFKLSKNLAIDANLDLQNYNPSSTAALTGTAVKESGSQVDGFVEASIISLNLYKSGSVIDGNINLNFQIPSNAKSGAHSVTIRVYDVDRSGKILNDGNIIKELNVASVLTELKISASSEKIEAGDELVYRVTAHDQAGYPLQRDISIVIYGPEDVIYGERTVKSDVKQRIQFATSDTPGYWKIKATLGGYEKTKLFYVKEVKKIQASLINKTLTVTNVGNVHYTGAIQISIGSNTEEKQLELEVGEAQKYNLYAPEGNYQISFTEGAAQEILGNTFLTGNAVKVVDVKEGLGAAVGSPVVQILAAVLLILIIVLFIFKRKGISRTLTPQNSQSQSLQSLMSFQPRPVVQNNSPIMPATSIQQGTKENASAIVIRAQALSVPQVNETINKALSEASATGAKIYVEGENKIILFSKLLTKQDNNEVTAVKTAQKIDEILNRHNRMYREKINYGIGVNGGEIISEIKDGHFKFATLGSLISGAKRIAFTLGGKVLMSDSMHRKVASTITTEKAGSGDTWVVTRVRDRSEYKEFLDRFNKKM